MMFIIWNLSSNIEYRIGVDLRHLTAHARARFGDDVAENLFGKLLALIMSDDGNLKLLLVAKILMIVHLARHKGIGTGTDGGRQQEVTRSSTD